MKLSQKDVRFLALDCQGLAKKYPFGRGPESISKTIEQIGYVQIDTISVVERAHHHVFWSRLPDYRPSDLDKVFNKKDGVFEYWTHAASLLPMKSYRFTLIPKKRRESGANLWFKRDDKILKEVYDRVKADGPLSSLDFENRKQEDDSGWWNWKPAKKALEQLFLEGRLMVKERKGFRKVYDLPDRVLPYGVKTESPSESEYTRFIIETTIGAHGIASLREICYQRSGLKEQVTLMLPRMVEEGTLLNCLIEGHGNTEFFMFKTSLDRLGISRFGENIKILSPFDNTVIQRDRLSNFFNFQYQIECYLPASKRKYGYFSLPLLYKDEFIGMIDCKADRANKVLIVKNCHYTHTKPMDNFVELLDESLKAFASFNSCETVLNEKQ
jgi:hypothetical protein